MPTLGALILVLIVSIPILPSVFLTLLGAVALRRKQRFLYYNSSFAAVFNIILLLAFLIFYSVVMRGQKREDLFVLLAIVTLGFILSGGAFLFGYIVYKINGSSGDGAKALPWCPLWVSIAAIFFYPFLLVISLMQPAWFAIR